MRDEDLTRLRHMIDAAQEAIRFAQDRKRTDLDEDRMLTLALIKAVEIIGEAASKISPELRERRPEIPWPAILNLTFYDHFRMVLNTPLTVIGFSKPSKSILPVTISPF
jgi:hypothetical protein